MLIGCNLSDYETRASGSNALAAAATNEYEDEIDLFLGRVDDTMGEEELIDVLHSVFQEMFNDDTSSAFREKYRPVIREYLALLNSAKNGGDIHH